MDVGDLDRVIQVNVPPTVAAFLQRLGRSGRRPGTMRNCLFLVLNEDELLLAAGLLLAWSCDFVEQVTPSPEPRHIVAQQLLALCLQEKRIGERLWEDWLALPELTISARPIANYLIEQGFVDREDAMLFIGPEADLPSCKAGTRSAGSTRSCSSTGWRDRGCYCSAAHAPS